MPNFPILDELDRSIVMALQINGRASWRQIAAGIGSAESTVTRRGQQLLAARVVAVTGVLDHLRCGLGISVYIRIRARPGMVQTIAQSVAALPAPRFVTLTIGKFDIATETVVENYRDILLVMADIKYIDDVLETESMIVVRKFKAFEEWHPGRFTQEETLGLRKGGTATAYAHRDWTEPERLSPLEFRIASVLALDGRATYGAIASQTGISESTAARRVESLLARGCIRFRTIFESPVIGYNVDFMAWLTVEPDRLEEIGVALSAYPAIRYVSATTGRCNIIFQGAVRDYGDLYPFMTKDIGKLPGILSIDLTPQTQTLKRAWWLVDDEGRPTLGPRDTAY